jgi:hypothetical protein
MDDRAYWITWYDLPEEKHEDHQAWFQESYIPKMLGLPGVLWGAHYGAKTNIVPLGGGQGRVKHHAAPGEVPGGKEFILIFGAATPHVFSDPGAAAFHEGLTREDRSMLEAMQGVRTNLMLEEARVVGPGVDPETPVAPAIQLGSFNAVRPDVENELSTWYARWRLPSISKVPGIVRVRKLVSVAGWAKHACFYEFNSLAERDQNFVHYEDGNPEMVAWSSNIVADLVHATPGAIVAERIWPSR